MNRPLASRNPPDVVNGARRPNPVPSSQARRLNYPCPRCGEPTYTIPSAVGPRILCVGFDCPWVGEPE